jgi:hypothetical protein
MNLVAERKSDVRSEAGSCQCRSQHREGNTPVCWLGLFSGTSHPTLTRIAACNDLAISLSCSSLGLLPRISGSQNVPTAPFMCPILPCDGAGAFTHCEGSRPTPHTMYACVSVLGLRAPCLTLSVEGSGCVILECREEVRLGMIRLWSALSRVGGRSPVRGRRLSDGAITNRLWVYIFEEP